MRKNPGKLNYGSAGNGTSHHLAGELFKLQTKTFITHIPYRGAGPALQDLIAGQVDMMFDGLGSSAAHIKAGRIKALAVASQQARTGLRRPAHQRRGRRAPTTRCPPGTASGRPRARRRRSVDQMQAEMNKAFAADEIKSQWNGIGAEMPNLYGDDFGRFVSSEVKRWAEVVKASGAKLD